MATGSGSPRSQQRLRIFDAYRGRGRRNNNLWLVYSVKTQRDWILASDRQLIHWIYYLETDSSVKWFNLVTNEAQSSGIDDGGWSQRDADVVLTNGSEQWHKVNNSSVGGTDLQSILVIDNSNTGDAHFSQRRVFGDSDLKPHVPLAMRWLKALAYAAAIRDQDDTTLLRALIPTLRSFGEGTVRQVADSMAGFESAAVYGSLVRLAIEGHVDLDLVVSGFCSATSWRLRDGSYRVVA